MPAYPMTPTPSRVPLKKPGLPPPMQAVQPGAMTSLGGIPQPVQPGQIQAPNLPGSPAPPSFTYAPPTLGAAPTATPFGAFQAPGADALNSDPGVQFRLEQANKGANRSAAAHGNLLSGGFQTALAKLNQGLASQEYGNLYDRALRDYTTNRDTNQQNFGQSLGSYQAGTGAQLDAGRLGLSAATAGYDRTYQAGRDTFNDARDAAQQQAAVTNANTSSQDVYRQQVEEARALEERQRLMAQTAPPTLGFAPRAPMPGAPGPFGRGRR